MELKEAFDIIDATLGMFRSFAAEIDNRDPKENFLATPVRSEVQTVMTVVDGEFNPDIECKEYYNDVDGDREYKMYIVNIRPVCNYIVNEWPSSKAKKLRKLLYVVFRECLDICEEPLKGIIDVAKDEGYSYHMRYNSSTQDSRTIESVMLDTIHEMYHALGLTEHAESDADDQNNKDDNSLSLQIERGLAILRRLNDLEELDINKIVIPIAKIHKDQKFYDTNKIGVLETCVNNWKSETETCLALKGISIDNNNPFRIQLHVTRLMDKRKGLADEIQMGLDFLYHQKKFPNEKGDNLNDSIGNNNLSTIPKVFKTPEAEQLMRKLMNDGLLDANWQPFNLSIAERGYLADEISNRLKIKNKWKVLGALWNENSETLRQGKNKAVEQPKTGVFIERLKNILA